MLKAYQDNMVTTLKTGRNGISQLAGYYAYCYLVGDTIIDTSTRYVQDELITYLSTRGIRQIVNTHHHEDHTGNNYYLQQALGISAFAPAKSLVLMQTPPPQHQRFYLRIFWSYPHPSSPLPLSDSIDIAGIKFDVINTPGHCDDHVCFYNQENRLIFTGDVYCGERVKYLRSDENFNRQLQTIRQLSQLDINTIYCAVAGKVNNGKQALVNKLNFMEELQGNVFRLRDKGLTATEIRQSLLGREGMMYWFSNGHFAKQNMIASILKSEVVNLCH